VVLNHRVHASGRDFKCRSGNLEHILGRRDPLLLQQGRAQHDGRHVIEKTLAHMVGATHDIAPDNEVDRLVEMADSIRRRG
jgi:hypothetical protein